MTFVSLTIGNTMLPAALISNMALKSNIQWTDATWNIARGCTKVDEDCKFCYMYRDSFDSTRYNPLQVLKTKTVFNLPLKLKEPSKIFTSSLTDVFHTDCDAFRNEMWEIIRICPQRSCAWRMWRLIITKTQ